MKNLIKVFVFILMTTSVFAQEGQIDIENQRLKNSVKWHENLSKGRGVKVAVIDTGIMKDYPGLILQGQNCANNTEDATDIDGHGTASTSVIHALAPEVEIIPMKVTDFGMATRSELIQCVLESIKSGAEIINISMTFDSIIIDRVRDAIGKEKFQKILFIVSGGNSREYRENDLGNNIITVGATLFGWPLTPTSYSARGPGVEMWAPAGDVKDGITVHSIEKGQSHRLYNGTSAAAPVVSAGAAILKERYPELNATELKELILDKSTSFGGKFFNYRFLNLKDF